MKKEYTITRSDLIKGCRWLVFERINKMVQVHVYGAMTKKECQEWVRSNGKIPKQKK